MAQHYTPADLRKYQWKAFWFTMRNLFAALFIDMGLGKTIVILSVIKALKHKKKLDKPVLIVGPIRVIYQVWRQEAAKWSHVRKLRFSLVHGNAKQRMAALEQPADIYLVNPQGIVWLLELFNNKKAIENWPFSWLIVDESSMFKAAGTKRFSKLRHYVHLFKRRSILTGTPRPNHLLELWAQIFLLDCGERLGTSFVRFKERFFVQADHQGRKWVPRRGAEQYITRLIGDLVLRMELKDWKSVPPTVYNRVEVELPDDVREMYDRFEEEMFLELAAGDVEALNAASLTGRCHQIANGAIYSIDRESSSKIWEPLHDAKMDALEEIIAEVSGPVLIVYGFKHDLARLRTRYPDAPVLGNPKTIDRMIKEIQNDEHEEVLAHAASAGYGLDGLQFSKIRNIVFFCLTWSREQHDQLINRIGGARAQHKITVHYIVARNTTDEAIMLATVAKGAGQQSFLAALKQYRKEAKRPTAEEFEEDFMEELAPRRAVRRPARTVDMADIL